MKIPDSLKRTFSLYAAQIVNLFMGWVVAKLNITYLSVTEYGQFSFFITAINIIYVFFTFGVFESASRMAALSKYVSQYRRILAATIIFSLISYFLFSLFFWMSHYFVDSIFKVHISRLILLLFPLAGIYLVSNMWQLLLRGSGKIYRLSCYLAAPRLLYALALIILAYLNKFVLETTAFLNLASLMLVVVAFFFIEKPDFHNLNLSIKNLWQEVKTFGVHIYWSELVKILLYHTDKLFISFFLDAQQLAYYALAYTITFPLSMFSTALSTTYYRKFSELPKINRRVLVLNMLWVIISVALLITLKKWIILKLFSEKYLVSIDVFPILAIAFGFGGLTKLYSFYLTAQGAGKAIRNISVAVLIVHLGLNLILIPRLGIMGAAFAALVTYAFDFIISTCYYFSYRHKSNIEDME